MGISKYLKCAFYSSGKGQALLFVIVAMVIALTITLSVASRSILNLRSSTDEQESQEAFSAAEAGVEQFLKTNNTVSNQSIGRGSVSVSKQDVAAAANQVFNLNNGNPILQDDGADVWLSSGPPSYSSKVSTTLTFLWGTYASCSDAALSVLVISGADINSSKIDRYNIDPCAARRSSNNFFSTSDNAGRNSYTLSAITNGIVARVIPIYTSSAVSVQSSVALPVQGSVIESTGSAGDAKRKITVFRPFDKIPNEFFQYVLLSL